MFYKGKPVRITCKGKDKVNLVCEKTGKVFLGVNPSELTEKLPEAPKPKLEVKEEKKFSFKRPNKED